MSFHSGALPNCALAASNALTIFARSSAGSHAWTRSIRSNKSRTHEKIGSTARENLGLIVTLSRAQKRLTVQALPSRLFFERRRRKQRKLQNQILVFNAHHQV